MATIVLTAVGTLFGGPIGGAIGAALGQRLDQAIIGGGKAREGPRLKELDVQTSSYGTQVPAIFGAMRVAGTVIWSTDLIERKIKSGGSKGRPSTVNYSYSASFAVALSSRPVARIGRIWADGNLLRGAAGDFKTETQFRFYSGDADQPVDPLMASAEAGGQCPAHRGIAYAMFEDLQLADFGNRIPSLTFEVFERELPVKAYEIAAAASAGAIWGDSVTAVSGYAVQGDDCRSAIQPLLASLPVLVRADADRFVMQDWADSTGVVETVAPVVRDGGDVIARPENLRRSHSKAANQLSIRHYDPARDFQAGVQNSRRVGSGRREVQIDVPAALNAAEARRLCDAQLLQQWRSLNGASLSMPRSEQPLNLGQRLAGTALRIAEIEHFRGSTKIIATEWVESTLQLPGADPGRNQVEPDLAVGATRLMVLDLPALDTNDPGRPVIAIAATGTAPGWRRAALAVREVDRTADIGGTVGIAAMGELLTDLPAHSALLRDDSNQPVLRMLHNGLVLPPGTGNPASFDAPLIWLGGEILRYGLAEKIGDRDYRLKSLIRGGFGTGDGPTQHFSGTACLLLEPDSLHILEAMPTAVGADLVVEALGLGDDQPVTRELQVAGNAIRPRSPVHGKAEWQEDGGIRLSWMRRDRLPHPWLDGADVPDSEGSSSYGVELAVDAVVLRNWTIATNSLSIGAAEIASLNITAGAIITFHIVHQGRLAQSPALALTLQY